MLVSKPMQEVRARASESLLRRGPLDHGRQVLPRLHARNGQGRAVHGVRRVGCGVSFDGLTASERERLTLLAEESAEVVQAVTKVLRHGFECTHPERDELTNRGQLAEEIGQLLAIVELACDAGDVNAREVYEAKRRKLDRVQAYLHSPENVRRCKRLHAVEK